MNRVDIFLEREKYRNNFLLFCRDILGYKNLNKEHRELCSLMVEGLKKLILMPRFTFKSCICTVGYALFRLVNNYNMRILIYSDAATKAEGFLGSIKNHIEGKVAGSRFREVFGCWEVDPKKDKWNQSQIVIAKRTSHSAEPSIDTGGQDTSKIGFHYDLIIFDDLVSDKNITTKEQMDKTTSCYKKALSLLTPTGEMVIVGTRWHFGDLYGRLIEENKENNLFKVFLKKAVEDGRYLFADIGDNSLTRERLALLRAQQGTSVYSCLYLNDPADDEAAVFKAKDFAFSEVRGEDLYITVTCDPAGKGEDYTAITVVGTDCDMNMHILDAVNQQKMLPSEIAQRLVDLHYKHKFKVLGIETNFYRGMLKAEIEKRRDEEHKENPTTFPLFGINEFVASSRRGESKELRIKALQPYHERGSIKFPGKNLALLEGVFSELAYQMIQFPSSAHDDLMDSLSMHLSLIRRGGLAKAKEPPWSSPAWFEREQMKQELTRNARLPRKLRKYIPPLAFS